MTLRAGLIILGLGASLLSGCGGQDSASTASSPSMRTATTAGSAPDESPSGLTGTETPGTAEPRIVTDFTGFRSPSSNVGCYIDVDHVRCDIAEANWSPPPRPADCEYDYGQGITLEPGGRAEFECAGDTALAPDGSALPYGESIIAGPLRCDSAESGITCRDTKTRSPARPISCSDPPRAIAPRGFVPPRTGRLLLPFATGDDLARGMRM